MGAVGGSVNLPVNQRQCERIKVRIVNVIINVFCKPGRQGLKRVTSGSFAQVRLDVASSQPANQTSGKTSQWFEGGYQCLYQWQDFGRSLRAGKIKSLKRPAIGYGGRTL